MSRKKKPRTNTIYRGDNLHIMRTIEPNSFDLVYIDPPFFTQKDYKNIWGDKESVQDYNDISLSGFRDTKDFFEKHVSNGATGLHAYLTWMRARIEQIHL